MDEARPPPQPRTESHSSAGSPSIGQQQQQPQKLPACDRCKSRKIKCDGSVPSCGACNKARVECVGRDKLPSVPRGLIHELQKRIRELEASLAGKNGSRSEQSLSPSSADRSMPPPAKRPRTSMVPTTQGEEPSPQLGVIASSPAGSGSSPSAATAATAESSRGPKQWMLGSMADYLDPTTTASASTPSSSTISRAPNTDESQQDWELAVELRFLAELRRDAVAQVSQMSVTQRAELSAYEPTLVDRLVRRYLSFLNDALPIFHEHDLIETVTAVRSNAEVPSPKKCIAHLVIALAFATLARAQHRSSELARCAKLHWTVAQSLVPAAMQRTDVAKLQTTLLLLQYSLLFPEGGNSWELSGSAMRLAAELSLYREARDVYCDTRNLRRKLFWTAYCLDVSLAVALARPTAMCDSWISRRPPDGYAPGESASQGGSEKAHPSFLEHIKLRRLQSNIYHHLYACDDESLDDNIPGKRTAPSSPSSRDQSHDAWFRHQLAELTAWRREFKQPTPFITAQWTELNFQITRTLMFRPSPRVPFPSVSGLMEALDSSSKTIKLYKLNHRTSRINFPWLATHHVFMAGLTYLHSLKSLHDMMIPTGVSFVDVTMHVQSCASLLEALNTFQDDEDSHRVRDAFDAAAYAVLNNLFSVRNDASMFGVPSPSAPPTSDGTVSSQRANGPPSSRLDDLATSAVMALPSAARSNGSAEHHRNGTVDTPSMSGMLNGYDTPQRSSTPTRGTGTPSASALVTTGAAAAADSSMSAVGHHHHHHQQQQDDASDFAFLDWFLHPIDTRCDWTPQASAPNSSGLGGIGSTGGVGGGGVGGLANFNGNGSGAGAGLFWDEKMLDWM